jgi:cupin 2 domain-containing protein
VNNIFEAIPEDLKDEKFELLVESGRVRIERIISKGHTSPESGWYDQEQNEWVMVLRGKAVLAFEDEASITLQEGDFVDIPAHKKHKVEWTAPDIETLWLAVHY